MNEMLPGAFEYLWDIVRWAFAVIAAWFGYKLNSTEDKHEALVVEHNNLKLDLAQNYPNREELSKLIEEMKRESRVQAEEMKRSSHDQGLRLETKIDKIEVKIDRLFQPIDLGTKK